MLALVVAAGSLRPDPGRARAWLDDELRRAAYHQQSLAERLASWLHDLWEHLTDSALHASSLSTAAAVVIAVALLLLVLLVAARVRVEVPARRPDDVLGPAGRSADDYRAAALAATEDGRYADAAVAAFRAVAARSLERDLLADRPGLTAHEIAEAVSPVAPEHRDHLLAAAATFEAVFYGGGTASARQVREILALDEALRGLEPGQRPARIVSGYPAVPR